MQSFRLKGLLVALIGALSYIVSSAQVTSVPYFEGFEDPTQYSSWNIPTLSSQPNNWRIDAGTSYAGSKSLYISDGTASVYQPSYSGTGLTLFCYQEFDLPAGNYDLSFAWKALGDGNDGLYVFWLPTNMPMNSYTSEISPQHLNLAMNVDVDGTQTKVLKGSSKWKIATATITSTGTRMRLYFAWAQNGSGETNPPACIDNVQIAKQSCKPSNINAVVNGSNVTISWSGTASSYELQYRTYGQSNFITKKNITGNSVTISNLSEGVYDIMVRGICPPDTSVWVVKDNILIYDPLAHCMDFINLDAADCRSGSFSNPHQTPGKVDYGSTSIQSRHTVNKDPNAYDANTKNQLPLIAPGEVVSIRLGNWDTGAQAESITYTYTIDSGAKQILILKYAIVLEDPNHGASEQPKFTLELLDENGRNLDQCGNVNFVASSTMAGNGWHREISGSSTIMWKEWTTTGVNLTPYAANGDKTIRIRLTTYDCSQSGHFGYAYFSLNCAEATISGISCGAIASASVSAPIGFNYEWTKATDTTTIVSRDKDLAVQSTDTSLYYCKVISQDNSDCYFVLEANLLPNYPKARFVPKWTPKDCKNYVTLQNSSAIWTDRGETGKPCETFYWDFDNGTTSNDSGSPVIEIPDSGGTYNFKLVVGISEDQCQDSLIYTFKVPSIKPTRDTISAQICKGQIYPFDGKRLKISGEYISNQQNAGGCDSITVLYLDVVSSVDTVMYDTICAGETYVLNGQSYTKSGPCQFTTKTQGGCDSIVTVHLYVYDPIEFKTVIKDEDEGPNTGEIIISDTLDTWTRVVNGVENGRLDSLKAGIYSIVYINEYGCSSDTVKLEVKRTCLKGNFGAVPLICADDSTFSVEFNVQDGSYSSYNLRFGADAKAAGFEDVDSVPNNGLIEIAVPENVRPDTYSVTVNFYDPTCGEHPEQLQFDIYYSNTIMAQKFNDVIALLNSKYNGGYDFTSYQWYKNGQPIPGAIKSYIYIGPNETFNINDSYSVAVVRAGESKSIMSCALIPVTRTDVSPYLKMNVSGVRQHLPISPSDVNGEAIWWSISGQMVDRSTVDAYEEYVVTPYQQGVYILELRFGDSRELYKVFIK